MKYLQVIFIFFWLNLSLWGQMSKFGFAIEYSPNYAKITDRIADENYKLSHNIFAKSMYFITEKFGVSLSLGLLNTGESETSEFGGNQGIEKIKFVHNYNYIAIPMGIKFNGGSWFIHLEFAAAVSISNKMKKVTWYSDGHKDVEKEVEHIYGSDFNQITIPIVLTTGYEIELNNLTLILGIKGYYSLSQVGNNTPRNDHYYGVGIATGIEF